MTDTPAAPLPPDTLLTVANLAQALAQVAAGLPEITDTSPKGTLAVNGGLLEIVK